jgi:hypothetical protein
MIRAGRLVARLRLTVEYEVPDSLCTSPNPACSTREPHCLRQTGSATASLSLSLCTLGLASLSLRCRARGNVRTCLLGIPDG